MTLTNVPKCATATVDAIGAFAAAAVTVDIYQKRQRHRRIHALKNHDAWLHDATEDRHIACSGVLQGYYSAM